MKVLIVGLMVLLICGKGFAQQNYVLSSLQTHQQVANVDSENALVGALKPIAGLAGLSLRLYVRGNCEKNEPERISFPNLDVQSSKGKTGLEAIREILRSNQGVYISQDDGGLVRIYIRQPDRTVLDTKLDPLHLDHTARYNPDGPGGSIASIEDDAAVQSAMRSLKARQVPAFFIGLRIPPDRALKHLPPILKDMTVDKALDLVARTFPGVVVYNECPVDDGHRIDVKFDWFKAGQ
jgi:hypothetical protein